MVWKAFLFPRANSAGKINSKERISTVACLALVWWPSKTIKNSMFCEQSEPLKRAIIQALLWRQITRWAPKAESSASFGGVSVLDTLPYFVAFACLRCDRCPGTSLGEDFGIRPPQLVVRSMQRPVETGCGLWCEVNIHVNYVLELWPRLEDFGDSKLAEV